MKNRRFPRLSLRGCRQRYLAADAAIHINTSRRWIASLSLAMTVLLFCALPTYAQESAPGSACTAGEDGRFRLSGGAELAGVGHLITCNGTNWIKVFSFDTTGVIQPQFTNTGSCGDGDTLTYNSATGGMTCNTACSDNTPDSFNFTDNASASQSTLTTSNILQITGITCQVNVTISGEGSPQYRTCSDSGCSTVIQDWTDTSTGINNNEYVQMRLTTSAAGGDTFTANLTVGNTIDDWNVTPTGTCVGSPAPGTVCADGTIYAGQSPDGNVAMYTSRCDEGMSWSGAACTGSRVSLPWNNGNGSDYVSTGTGNSITGQANTSTLDGLDSDSGTAGTQLHQAAQRCADLNLNGHTDWYLPAQQELNVLYLNNGVIGNFNTGGSFYWSSTEFTTLSANRQRISDGGRFNFNKLNTLLVRCVRR